MTFRWRIRHWLAWHLLAVVEWLIPTGHAYNSAGRIDPRTRCALCQTPLTDRDRPCRPLQVRTLGARPRLRRYGRTWERPVTDPGDKQPPAPPPPLRIVR